MTSYIRLTDMKTISLTIKLDNNLEPHLKEASRRSGKDFREIVTAALRKQLILDKFDFLRKSILPFAEARGYFTDEDVFNRIS